jgi:hypothetical protein
MPNFRSTSNSAKPVLVRLSTMLSIKKRPYSYAKIVFSISSYVFVETRRASSFISSTILNRRALSKPRTTDLRCGFGALPFGMFGTFIPICGTG